jgi:hypothetical protein
MTMHEIPTSLSQNWSKAVIRVNEEAGGRGFVVELEDDYFIGRPTRYVITAAHCLPEMPPAIGGLSYTHERTYGNVLGPLGEQATVWAECVFVDPVADVAVLGAPDNQILSEEADAYDEFMDNAVPLPMGGLGFTKTSYGQLEAQADVFLLSLRGDWVEHHITSLGRTAWSASAESIEGGMSGSPIVTRDGIAVGVVASTAMHPLLMASLPGWLVRS